ncbi:MAG: FtsW/RodA/SpoVE family cell cycle protein [Epsilonproteobacteria bacterium]|nr:FtsW/RodA/SpoVE family cell cycle protein [Campylobacterota bacterium]OIO17807.1 MAG: cell division protein [Helicobacteraceae bacterium CG1_02_36_14]PIP10505.1 MAG: cell division protein [Sulfurimonas sp. CG23_combo_of_CG06-09_8_20_14_all_36_33]PIS26955.1 MAG: cell division protein [Sulfurimonas sp. CG08_land_8_20_14_0_20_36_33]PIU35849.1 MAG: cell division protein [Sulfurimonas sp. CG07_land_8_20_14_0_80_36_56]PIV03426.1 MAG: cell division protein [Sulfurimonas sp. CG03_land_8_20_14_0_80_
MADRKLFTLVSILIAVSVILSYTLSTYTTILFGVNEFYFAVRQAFFAIFGISIIWMLAQLDPDKWLKPIGFTLFIGSTLLMIAMPFLPEFLVSAVGGAKRWIKIFGFSLAPVEFFKVGFVYFLAWSFSRKLGHHDGMGLKNEMIRFSPYAVVFIGAMFIIAFIQNDLGQVVVLGLTLLFMLMFAGSSFRFFLSILLASLLFFIFFIFTAEHRILRIKSWWALAQNSVLELFPASIAQQLRIPTEVEPYQIGHSLNAIHNGGIFGTGIASGTFKLGFLSEVHTDFILAGLAEEFGFIGVLFVVVVFMWMLQRIFKVANRSRDTSIYLFSLGIGLLLSFSFLVNAYGISGITPIKGISVPFLSYGGSALLGAAFGIGMVLMASKKVNMDKQI